MALTRENMVPFPKAVDAFGFEHNLRKMSQSQLFHFIRTLSMEKADFSDIEQLDFLGEEFARYGVMVGNNPMTSFYKFDLATNYMRRKYYTRDENHKAFGFHFRKSLVEITNECLEVMNMGKTSFKMAQSVVYITAHIIFHNGKGSIAKQLSKLLDEKEYDNGRIEAFVAGENVKLDIDYSIQEEDSLIIKSARRLYHNPLYSGLKFPWLHQFLK